MKLRILLILSIAIVIYFCCEVQGKKTLKKRESEPDIFTDGKRTFKVYPPTGKFKSIKDIDMKNKKLNILKGGKGRSLGRKGGRGKGRIVSEEK